MFLEQVIIYGLVFSICGTIIFYYLRSESKKSQVVAAKVNQAKIDGLFEPVSLHPVIDLDSCIKSGACYAACPEKDILGIVNGRATLINASNCIGHGACFHACPVEAISLVIGTEKRGVDLPHINEEFETNVEGIYIAGELGGMGLIKNGVEQGQEAVNYMIKKGIPRQKDIYDLFIVGAGPAGISAALQSKKMGLNFKIVDQDTLGGTVYTFPRSKIVMTSPMDLPLHGKVKLYETSKTELIELWEKVLTTNNISIQEHTKIESIERTGTYFSIQDQSGKYYQAQRVLLAIGRRGTPRKLGIPGEMTEKVAYRLLEPELIQGEKIMVVGGGDSAVESAMLLMDQNEVILSYRKDTFSRIKPKNRERIQAAIDNGKIKMAFNTVPVEIKPETIILKNNEMDQLEEIPNHRIYIFAGGELPTAFLKNSGIEISKRFGYTVKQYKK
jgi:thioredoxin reductase/NAD-dependent dihydropyrimidine dehydrogenase PreA subunit